MLNVINLEKGLPTVSEALDTFDVEVTLAKIRKQKCALVVHGYGKRTQGGGKIKVAARELAKDMEREGIIKRVIFGEDLSPFNEEVMRLRYEFDELKTYVGKRNIGVMLIVF